jgi:hypothetical protein
MTTFVSFNSRLLNTVHALYARELPSPRVRCLLACFTYLLATYDKDNGVMSYSMIPFSCVTHI